MRTLLHKVALWFTGLVVGAFIVVQDEILTEVAYCGPNCEYPYPLIGSYSFYAAESIADAVIIAALLLGWWAASGLVHREVKND